MPVYRRRNMIVIPEIASSGGPLAKVLAGEASQNALELLLDISDNMAFKTICALAEAARAPIESFIKKFRSEFEFHLEHGRCDLS